MEQGHTILIVDNDPRICRLIQRYLEQEGYLTYTATSGEEMRQKLAQERVDLMLLDVRLLDESGFSLEKELGSIASVAVIMVTENPGPYGTVPGLERGVGDYVTKPFNEKNLLARVRSVLRRRSGKSPESGIPNGVHSG